MRRLVEPCQRRTRRSRAAPDRRELTVDALQIPDGSLTRFRRQTKRDCRSYKHNSSCSSESEQAGECFSGEPKNFKIAVGDEHRRPTIKRLLLAESSPQPKSRPSSESRKSLAAVQHSNWLFVPDRKSAGANVRGRFACLVQTPPGLRAQCDIAPAFIVDGTLHQSDFLQRQQSLEQARGWGA